MRKHFFITFFSCILLLQLLQGQSPTPSDSLIQVLHFTHDNKTKARLLLRISKSEELRDPQKALRYAQQALKLAQIADFDSAEVRAMMLMGINYNRLKLLKEAIEIGEQVVEKASKNNMQLEIADGRCIMAVAYAQGGDFDNSSKLYFENLRLYEKLNEKRLLGSTLGNIGADFFEQQSYEKALEYINKALKIGRETNNLALITDQYNNLAAIYQVGFKDLPAAMHNYSQALKIAIKIEDFQQQGCIMLNMGYVYLGNKIYDSAFFYFNKALLIFQKLNNPILLANIYTELGNYHFQKGELTQSRKYASDGLAIGIEYNKLQTIFNSSELLNKICLREKDSIEAYKYHVIRTNAQDSLSSLQNQKELFKLEFQYNQEKAVKEHKIKQLKYFFILGFIILGLLSSLAIILLFNSRQKIKTKNALLEKGKAESDLKFKNKELSINLMALLKKNELIAEISQKVADLENNPTPVDLKEAVNKLNHEIKQSSDDRLWQEFSIRFKETNSEFYDKLLKKYPDLTQSQLKLCAYLRLNMSTKEISELTAQRTETIEKSRYRLRKRFGLNNSESNLVVFLSQI